MYIFLTYFDYFSGVILNMGESLQTWGRVDRHQRGEGPPPRQIEHCRWAPFDPLAPWAPQPPVRPWEGRGGYTKAVYQNIDWSHYTDPSVGRAYHLVLNKRTEWEPSPFVSSRKQIAAANYAASKGLPTVFVWVLNVYIFCRLEWKCSLIGGGGVDLDLWLLEVTWD